MGNVVDSIFGGSESKQQSSTTTNPKDLTPQEFKNLRPGVAGAFRAGIEQGGGPEYQGQFSAGVTANEQQLLNQIQQQAMSQGGAAGQASQDFLQNLISGQGPQNPALSFGPVQLMQGGTTMSDVNPFLQAQIEAATRPLLEQFNEETLPGLRAQFAQAGQQIQGQGSSPFEMAQARASSGLANAIGDVGTNLAAQDFAQRQALASQEFMQAQGLDAQSQMALQELQAGAFSDQMQQRLQGVAQATGLEQAQLDNLMASLEAQALPRLVEQYGIDQGLAEFRRRQDRLLQLMTTAGGLSSPTVGSVTTQTSSGSSSGQSPVGSAIGAGIGTFLGGF